MDFKRLRMADYVVAGGTLLFLVLALLPWQSYGDEFFGISYSGFSSSGAVSSAFVMFLLATAWALLPAFYDVKLSFPRAWITVGLAALGFLLTLVGWIASFDAGFSIWALLGLLAAAAILLFSLLASAARTPQPSGAAGRAGRCRAVGQPAPAEPDDRRAAGLPARRAPAPRSAARRAAVRRAAAGLAVRAGRSAAASAGTARPRAVDDVRAVRSGSRGSGARHRLDGGGQPAAPAAAQRNRGSRGAAAGSVSRGRTVRV